MLNNVILVGRITDTPRIHDLEDGTKVCNITLAVTKPFKNQTTGEYGVDFIPVSLWQGSAAITQRWCEKGDIVGIKGRISTRVSDVKGVNVHTLEVIGERIVFISLKSNQEQISEDVEEEDINE